ncbi:MAG: glycosyltransferase family 4 protein [Bacteroidetes bacterium]|nr:glycosyltransferase family 4 protein [Bacteroidota bacterium]
MRKILFITPYGRGLAGSQRFRFEHFFDNLSEHGYQYKQVPFVDESTYKIMYQPGHWYLKIWGVLKGLFRRIYALFLVPFYDVIFVHREATPLGTPVFEFLISKLLRKPYIYDFDDAIWRLDISKTNEALSPLRYSSNKIPRTLKMARQIMAGNKYLAGYASSFNQNIRVFPTIVDTSYHIKSTIKRSNDKICIGWTGTHTTLRHFEMVIPQLEKLYAKYRDLIYFKLIVNADVQYESLDLKSTIWNKEHEIEELSEFDIGLMPLPDDEWSNGKCGFKAIQYMSLEIACIASSVGVNSQIIDHDVNGLLLDKPESFYNTLETLIENEPLRIQLARHGRQKIKSFYSKESQLEHFINCISDGTV